MDDAKNDAERRFAKVASRIAGADLRGQDYAADIREELIARLDDHNLVTRNRNWPADS